MPLSRYGKKVHLPRILAVGSSGGLGHSHTNSCFVRSDLPSLAEKHPYLLHCVSDLVTNEHLTHLGRRLRWIAVDAHRCLLSGILVCKLVAADPFLSVIE